MLIKKNQDVIGLVTNTVLITKISEAKNKMPVISNLVKQQQKLIQSIV